jgi:DNA (cytosine-5)-methyltransferase 1
MLRAVELFTGAGGLGMGVHLAGFKPQAVVEWDKWACDTILENQGLGNPLVADWPVHRGDVREFDFGSIEGELDLLAGGPPCQPFSMGGKHSAQLDKRDMFPPTIKAIRELKPKAFIIENVKGLTRASFSDYLNYILYQLEYPDLVIKKNEGWQKHRARLEQARTSPRRVKPTYNVIPQLLNAANYGIPQKRERIFIVGFRNDIDADWSFPIATHSLDALRHDQWVSGEYWDRHKVAKKARAEYPARSKRRIEKLASEPPAEKPWSTVRDALQGLPSPRSPKAKHYIDHRFQGGARSYPGHTGSPIDLPAKTLKAGVHGVPGGENMIRLNDGSVRYFTIRESARLQTFPDTYRFHGSWSEVMRQLGNAVPVELGRQIASSVACNLLLDQEKKLKRAILKGAH